MKPTRNSSEAEKPNTTGTSTTPLGKRLPFEIVLGIGSNLGDRRQTLVRAVSLLGALPGVRVLRTSTLRETPAWGLEDQPPFLNGAVLVQTEHDPLELLGETRRIEAVCGRTREVRWGPRTLDIDLLWSHGLVVEHPDLTLPHAGLLERVFALEPLLELVPEAVDPRTGASYVASLDSLRKG